MRFKTSFMSNKISILQIDYRYFDNDIFIFVFVGRTVSERRGVFELSSWIWRVILSVSL